MKIRSHTGNMVDARTKMRCTVEKSSIPVTIETIDGDCAWCSFDVAGESRRMVYTAPHLTMIFAPFAAGDKYQAVDKDGNIDSEGTISEDSEQQELLNSYCSEWLLTLRHASPDLRPAEGL